MSALLVAALVVVAFAAGTAAGWRANAWVVVRIDRAPNNVIGQTIMLDRLDRPLRKGASIADIERLVESETRRLVHVAEDACGRRHR
jgi:hypothetical protein